MPTVADLDEEWRPIYEWARKYRSDPDGRRARTKQLTDFFNYWKVTPRKFLKDAEKKVKPGKPPIYIEDMIVEYLENLRDKDTADSSIGTVSSNIRSFFFSRYLIIRDTVWKRRSVLPVYEDTTRVPLEQANVRDMIASAPTVRHKAVIAFLAQTGQREGIVTALRWEDVDQTKDSGYAIARVKSLYKNRLGDNVNKIRSPFRFVIGAYALDLMHQLTSWQRRSGFVFEYGARQVNRIVILAAQRTGNQSIITRQKEFRGKPGIWHAVHAHSLRGYYAGQMRKANVHPDIVQYMMGKRLRDAGTYARMKDKELIDNYRNAEPFLAI